LNIEIFKIQNFTWDLPLTEEEKSLNMNNFDKIKNQGLPDNYNLVDGWIDNI
jgi:hypothetical protein